MAIVAEPAPAPFVPALSLDPYHQTEKTQIRDVWCNRDLRKFLNVYSKTTRLRMCGVRQHMCESWLCPRCADEKRGALRAHVFEASRAVSPGSVVFWTSTVDHTASTPLATSWKQLQQLSNHMTSGNWLGSRVAGYVRSTEIVHNDNGWHPHIHWVLVFDDDLDPEQFARLHSQIENRWMAQARRLLISTSPSAQKIELRAAADLIATLDYALKDDLVRPSKSETTWTPGDLLRAAYMGDAQALERFHELESCRGHHRFASGGVLRVAASRISKRSTDSEK